MFKKLKALFESNPEPRTVPPVDLPVQPLKAVETLPASTREKIELPEKKSEKSPSPETEKVDPTEEVKAVPPAGKEPWVASPVPAPAPHKPAETGSELKAEAGTTLKPVSPFTPAPAQEAEAKKESNPLPTAAPPPAPVAHAPKAVPTVVSPAPAVDKAQPPKTEPRTPRIVPAPQPTKKTTLPASKHTARIGPTAEQLCNISPSMTPEQIRQRLAFLYRRYNRASSSLNAGLRAEAEAALDAIVAVREKYFGPV